MKKFPILTKSFIDEIVNEEDVKLSGYKKNPSMTRDKTNQTQANLNLFWMIRTIHPTARVATPLPRLSKEQMAKKIAAQKNFIEFLHKK
jgi:hypothetical protein